MNKDKLVDYKGQYFAHQTDWKIHLFFNIFLLLKNDLLNISDKSWLKKFWAGNFQDF